LLRLWQWISTRAWREIKVATSVDNKLGFGVVLQTMRWTRDHAAGDHTVTIDVQGYRDDKSKDNLKHGMRLVNDNTLQCSLPPPPK
jgi:hypothetical protein